MFLLHTLCLLLNCWLLVECTSRKPNIVVIMVDDLGRNDVGYHGSEIKTPNIDELAAKGVKLENYYTAPVCGPTRAQFLSGRYSIHLGLQVGNIIACQEVGLPPQYPTIADKLKEQGYATHLVGKWHAGFHTEEYIPTNRGFDTFRGFLLGHGDHYNHTRPYKSRQYLDFYDNTTPYNESWGEYSTEVFTERAVDIIDSHNTSEPFFMWLSYQAPHNPMQVPGQYLDDYRKIKVWLRRMYAGMVAALDVGVGEVVDALKRNDLYENTVIIFSTDNGGDVNSGGSNFPLSGNKGSMYEGGIRAVGFVSSPLIKRPRRTVRDLIHVTDWLPTLLHIAGGNSSSIDIDGINQWHTISSARPSKRMEVLHNIVSGPRRPPQEVDVRKSRWLKSLPPVLRIPSTAEFDVRTRASIRVGDWKLITGNNRHITYPNPATNVTHWYINVRRRTGRRGPGGLIQLYNIRIDPAERRNVARGNPHIVDRLLRKLINYRKTASWPMRSRNNDKCDPSRHNDVWGPFI